MKQIVVYSYNQYGVKGPNGVPRMHHRFLTNTTKRRKNDQEAQEERKNSDGAKQLFTQAWRQYSEEKVKYLGEKRHGAYLIE